MRHAHISTTLDYYANLDAAVEEAVLGFRRNTRRNSEGSEAIETGDRTACRPSEIEGEAGE
jgi:hypothetical protein